VIAVALLHACPRVRAAGLRSAGGPVKPRLDQLHDQLPGSASATKKSRVSQFHRRRVVLAIGQLNRKLPPHAGREESPKIGQSVYISCLFARSRQ